MPLNEGIAERIVNLQDPLADRIHNREDGPL